jgi:rod shape-determining protein MreC
MQNLFQFLNKHNHLLVFILLEFIALSLIIQNNTFHRSAFINSSNGITTSFYNNASNINRYFSLRQTNEMLLIENAKLKSAITNLKKDNTTSIYPHQFIPSVVINNSVHKTNNYLTIDKGIIDGVKKGMGVISQNGIVGIVKESSKHFSSVLSILHSKSKVSVEIKKNNFLGSLEWNGFNYRKAIIKDIPTHVKVIKGDTIVTSGYSSTFPKDIPIGLINKIKTNQNENFHEIEITFLEDFKQLKYVNVCNSLLKEEKLILQQKNNE